MPSDNNGLNQFIFGHGVIFFFKEKKLHGLTLFASRRTGIGFSLVNMTFWLTSQCHWKGIKNCCLLSKHTTRAWNLIVCKWMLYKFFVRSTESIFLKAYLENCFKCSWSVKNKQSIIFQICSTTFDVKPNHEWKNSLRIKNIQLRGWPDLFTISRIFTQICHRSESGLEGYYFPRLSTSMLVLERLQRCTLMASVHHQHVSICLWSTNDVSKLVD